MAHGHNSDPASACRSNVRARAFNHVMACSAAPFCWGASASRAVVLTPLWWNQALTRELQNSLPPSVWNLKTGKFNDLSSMYTCCRASITWALLLLWRGTQNTSLAKSDGASYSQRVVSHNAGAFRARHFGPGRVRFGFAARVRPGCVSARAQVRFGTCSGAFRVRQRFPHGVHAERSQNPICAERRQNRISRQRRASRESNFPRRSCVERPQNPISQEPS